MSVASLEHEARALTQLEDLMARARREAGFDDFGDLDFVEPLKVFLSLDPHFTDYGRSERHDVVLGDLIARLRTRDWFKRHPEILKEDVSEAIMIIGFPRSGTTALQRMMSADPNVQALYNWQTFNPAPFPGETLGDPSPRIAAARREAEKRKVENPALYAAHPFVAEDAEEDLWIHNLTYQQIANYVWAPLQGYVDYLRTIPRINSYRYVADMYRFLQWQGGGSRGRPWLMKSPNHIGNIEEVLEVHPNTVFLYPQRDYKSVMASLCRLLELHHEVRMLPQDPHELGRVHLNFWSHELKRFKEARARLGDRLRILTMPYEDLLRDPMPYIREAYRMSGRELTPEGEAAIQTWRDQNPQGLHGKFEYEFERYGLTPQQIDDACGELEI